MSYNATLSSSEILTKSLKFKTNLKAKNIYVMDADSNLFLMYNTKYIDSLLECNLELSFDVKSTDFNGLNYRESHKKRNNYILYTHKDLKNELLQDFKAFSEKRFQFDSDNVYKVKHMQTDIGETVGRTAIVAAGAITVLAVVAIANNAKNRANQTTTNNNSWCLFCSDSDGSGSGSDSDSNSNDGEGSSGGNGDDNGDGGGSSNGGGSSSGGGGGSDSGGSGGSDSGGDGGGGSGS